MHVFDENDFPGNGDEEINNLNFLDFNFEFSDNTNHVNSFGLDLNDNNIGFEQHSENYRSIEGNTANTYSEPDKRLISSLSNNSHVENKQPCYTTPIDIQSMFSIKAKPLAHVNKKRKQSDGDVKNIINSLEKKDDLTKEEKDDLRKKRNLLSARRSRANKKEKEHLLKRKIEHLNISIAKTQENIRELEVENNIIKDEVSFFSSLAKTITQINNSRFVTQYLPQQNPPNPVSSNDLIHMNSRFEEEDISICTLLKKEPIT